MKNIIIKTLSVTFLSLITLAVSAQATNVKEKKETVKSGVKEVKTETKDTKTDVKTDVKDAKSDTKDAKNEVKSDAKEVNSDAKEIKNEVKEAPAEIKNEAAPSSPKKKGLNLDLGSPTQPAGLAPSGKGGSNQRVINEEGIKVNPSPTVKPK